MKYNLYLILADEQVFHPHYLEGVIKNAKKRRCKVVGITITKEKYKKGLVYAVKQQLYLWGFWGFSFLVMTLILNKLLYLLGIDKKRTLEGIATYYKIPLKEVSDVNSATYLAYFKKFNIDILISSNGQIFKKELLNLPRIACINRHSALLPNYGGVLPVFWAMFYREKQFGTSVHYMVEKIDQGNIIAQKTIAMNPKNSLLKNYMLAFDSSIFATDEALVNIEKGKIVGKYKKTDKSYFSFPKKEAIDKFKKKHKTFIISDIVDYIRYTNS